MLTAILFVSRAPAAPFFPEVSHGQPIIGILICHTGSSTEGDLAAVRAVPDPIVDGIAEQPYVDQQAMFDTPERLAHLVYFNALVPETGQSAFDLFPSALRHVSPSAPGATLIGDSINSARSRTPTSTRHRSWPTCSIRRHGPADDHRDQAAAPRVRPFSRFAVH